MSYFKGSLYFFIALFFHLSLVYIFSSMDYLLYFFILFVALYILKIFESFYNAQLFIGFSFFFILFFESSFFDEHLFEYLLKFELYDCVLSVDFYVKYILVFLHLLIFVTLKKFEKSWDIMGQNLLRR